MPEMIYTLAMELPAPTLVLNGVINWNAALRRQLERAEPLLAADGGANALRKMGRRPSVIIGDLDSVRPEILQEMRASSLRCRPAQETCDFEKSLAYVFDEAGLEELTVLGALGGRPDHSMMNLGILARECRGTNLIFRLEGAIVLALEGMAELEARPGEAWSFWSFDPTVRLSLEGVRWPLEGASVHIEGRPSHSNEATAEKVKILVEGGAVLICRNFMGEASI